MANLIAFGDSNAAGVSAVSWAPILATALGHTLVNRSISGYQAADLCYDAYGYTLASYYQPAYTPNGDDLAVFAIGTNDHRRNGTDATKKLQYERFLRCAILAHCAPSRVKGRPSGLTFTGTWADTQVNSLGKWSDTSGNKAAATVNGTAVYVQVTLQHGTTVDCDVKVDGVSNLFTLNGNGMTTVNGRNWAPACVRVGGLASGAHSVEVIRGTGGRFYIDQIIGSDQATKPRAIVCNIPRQTQAAYTNQGGGSDTTVGEHNTILAQVVSELAGDGLDVDLCDIHSLIDPSNDLGDGTHYNTQGANKVKDAISLVVNGTPPPPPEFTYTDAVLKVRNDGKVYAVVGAFLVELSKA